MEDLVPIDDGRTPSPAELAETRYAIQPELNDRLVEAINEMADIADRDCYGSDRDADPCDCDTCAAKRAIAKLNKIRLPVVRSLQEYRCSHAERVYFDAWVDQNTRKPGLNGGYGTLELILRGERDESLPKWGSHMPAHVSQRDMDVATTVVQWLGTNCGRCFIDQCEREWEKRREERRDFEHVAHIAQTWTEYREKPVYMRIADSIAEKFGRTDEHRRQLSTEIAKAMVYARKKAEAESFESFFKEQ